MKNRNVNMGNGLTGNIARVLSANFVVAVVSFLGSFIFPRILTISDYALYHTFTLYLGYIAITHLGFPSGMAINYAGKNYAEIDSGRYKSEIKILAYILILFTVIFGIYAFFSNNKMVAYIAIAIIPTGVISSYKSLLQSWSRFKYYGRLSSFLAISVPVGALLYYAIFRYLPGDTYILIYLFFYWLATFAIVYEMLKKVRGVRSEALLTHKNWQTEKTGIAILLGNYINTLFTSADKQFVKWFFTDNEFAFYSFGMSMQALMTVFITSIAQPLFPAMASEKFEDKEYVGIKNLLLIFGSLSGCAYFAISFVVKVFICKYTPSLDVVGIYFVVFPAMAVINCLYINLYKIKGLMKQYVQTLAFILVVALGLNAIFVSTYKNYTGVAIATSITYYLWLILGARQFRFIKFGAKDVIYLLIYLMGFLVITRLQNDILGFIVYLVFIVVLDFAIYKNDMQKLYRKFCLR